MNCSLLEVHVSIQWMGHQREVLMKEITFVGYGVPIVHTIFEVDSVLHKQ